MTGVIISGGFVIIVAVLGIFFFILQETLPLFKSADVTRDQSVNNLTITGQPTVAVGESGKDILLYDGGKQAQFFSPGASAPIIRNVVLPGASTPSAWKYVDDSLLLGTSDGKVGANSIHFSNNPSISEAGEFISLSEEVSSDPVITLDSGGNEDTRLYAAIQQSTKGERHLRLILLTRPTGLLSSSGTLTVAAHFDITQKLSSPPAKVLVNSSANGVIVLTTNGTLQYFEVDEDEAKLAQSIPHPLGKEESITVIDWIYGDVSLILGGSQGTLKTYSLFRQKSADGTTKRLFGNTKTFPSFDGAVTLISAGRKNKSFFAASGNQIKLLFNTSEEVRWEGKLDTPAISIASDRNFNVLAVCGKDKQLSFFKIHDPFPESGMKSLFSKIQYEGYASPSWEWQSSAANDDAEPKMSLFTLIFGTIKGTLYALVFAVPVAIMAAIYTAQFMPARVKRIVKPVMEIMASLPSVVLGFFGALYLAPRMEDKVPAILSICILLPLVAIMFGKIWSGLPVRFRNRYGHGIEYIIMIPVMSFLAWLCWSSFGGHLETVLIEGTRIVFSCLNHISSWVGIEAPFKDFQAANFAELWQNAFDLPFEQRNSLVVGFVMGFAVIPVIFTIAEDALSNVPVSLIAGAEALGASRWQIVRTVVLPIASAGIFSALMIGLGRAVGETMIVLMATGNTPITEWNVFNGMRTLSANIATELPEAVEHSGHYRVLFLSGLILFGMTFILNTVSEILRHKLRERFKVI